MGCPVLKDEVGTSQVLSGFRKQGLRYFAALIITLEVPSGQVFGKYESCERDLLVSVSLHQCYALLCFVQITCFAGGRAEQSGK